MILGCALQWVSFCTEERVQRWIISEDMGEVHNSETLKMHFCVARLVLFHDRPGTLFFAERHHSKADTI